MFTYLRVLLPAQPLDKFRSRIAESKGFFFFHKNILWADGGQVGRVTAEYSWRPFQSFLGESWWSSQAEGADPPPPTSGW